MRQRTLLAAVVAATLVAVGSTPAAEARRSPTTAHAYLHTKLGNYAATVTATRAAKAATLVVHLSRGDAAKDQQTHDYSFTLAPSTVTVDSKLGTARVNANLGSFGAVDLKLGGRGKTSTEKPSGCSGPATLTRSARAKGAITIKLGSLGTLRGAGRSVSLDRLQKKGTVKCPAGPCRRYAGSQIAGLNSGDNYLSIQSDGLGHTFVFGTVSQRLPKVSISHTRFAAGGTLAVTLGAGPNDRSIALTGGGPATGSLTFAGTGAAEADAGCKGHTVRRLSGPAAGSLSLPIDGVGTVTIAADGSATAPIAAYREQID
jgi:hypothetical protein